MQALVQLGDADRVGAPWPRRAGLAHRVGGEHGLERGDVAARRFLAHHADLERGRHPHLARVGLQLAGDQAQQRRLAGAVAADQGQARAGGHVQVRALEQRAAGDAQGDVGEVEHGGRLIAWAACPTPGDPSPRTSDWPPSIQTGVPVMCRAGLELAARTSSAIS